MCGVCVGGSIAMEESVAYQRGGDSLLGLESRITLAQETE